ncbi:hypothetical protein NCC49_006056 [Naganishia albida]|nr:hypothetical protein NCC49_006056 [Naganishia albida]
MQFSLSRGRHRLIYHLAVCVLDILHHLLIIAITTSRRFPNLLHWLPLVISVQGTLLEYGAEAVEMQEETVSEETVKSIINAVSDTALYWSLVKVPAQTMILVSTLPCAVTLVISRNGSAATQAERWARVAVSPCTILVVGIALLDAQKMDAYSFAQLAVAMVGKTVVLHPGWTSIAQRLVGNTSEWISSRITPHLNAIQARLPRLPPMFLDNPSIRRNWTCLKIPPHLSTTALIFLVDELGQLPKRWSFLTRSCWILGLGVMVARGLRAVIDRMWQKEEKEEQEGYSRVGADTSGEAVRDDRCRLIDVGLQSCISAAIAISIFAVTPTLIVSDTISDVPDSSVYVKSISSIAIAWIVLWLHAYRTGASGKPIQKQGSGMLGVEAKAGTGNWRAWRWMRGGSLSLALVPVILAVTKHWLSGNTLVALSGELEKLINTPDRGTIGIVHSGSSALDRKDVRMSALVHLPTIDVVVAYYSEPVVGVRNMISRLRSELTWAQVNVVVYHAGIPGYGKGNNTELGGIQVRERDASHVEEAVEQLRRDTGADLVVPKMNIGRDFGTYLQHIDHSWDSLAGQTIFIQAEPHATDVLWQRMRLVDPSVGFLSLGLYIPYLYPNDLGANWPFTELSLVWDKFHPDLPMPKDSPISITWNGQMVMSRATIRKRSRELWREMYEILLSEVDDPRHVPGFAWKAEQEGPSSPYFAHILERAWPLMADCYDRSLYDDCTRKTFADNANGGCLCRDKA